MAGAGLLGWHVTLRLAATGARHDDSGPADVLRSFCCCATGVMLNWCFNRSRVGMACWILL